MRGAVYSHSAFEADAHAAQRSARLAGNRSPEVLLAHNQDSGSYRGSGSYAHRDAINESMKRRRRSDAVREMQALRTRLPKISTDEVTRWIREEREHGH